MDDFLKHKLPVMFQPVFKSQRTLQSEQVSLPMKEPYILTGYRLKNQPWHYYVLSLFNWHNETFNVWTHLVAFVYVLHRMADLSEIYDLQNSSNRAIILGYSIGALVVTLLSTVAHLFHSRSLKSHYIFFMLDYMGVSMYSFGCGIVTLYCFCPKRTFESIGGMYIPLHLVLCFNNFLSCSVAKMYYIGFRRKLLTITACIASTFWMLVPIFATYYYCIINPACQIWSLNHIALMYVCLFSSTVAYIAHQPEISKPGMFDIVGHSHQWFHTFILFTIISQYRAMEYELRLHKSVTDEVTSSHILLLYVILVVIEMATIVLLLPRLKNKIMEIEHCEGTKQH